MNKSTKFIFSFLFYPIKRFSFNQILVPAVLFIFLTSLSTNFASAQQEDSHWYLIRNIYTSEFGLVKPLGGIYVPGENLFLVLDQNGDFTGITMYEEFGGTSNSGILVPDATNLAFDPTTNGIFALEETNTNLEKVGVASSSLLFQSTVGDMEVDLSSYGLQEPGGMTFASNGRLLILDTRGSQIVIIDPDSETGFEGSTASLGERIEKIAIKNLDLGEFRGIAFNSNNGHFYSLDTGEQRLYEFDENGRVVSTYDLSSLALTNPRTLLFAPSRNATDDPSLLHLFILDGGSDGSPAVSGKAGLAAPSKSAYRTNREADQQSSEPGGRIIEVSLSAPSVQVSAASLLPTTLIQTIDTSNASWNPSSPDPGGVAYWPARGSLLISDGEVEEMSMYFKGFNVFESSLTGTLLDTCSTIGWSNEPTGVAINPNNNHIFISDDSKKGRVHEINIGADGTYCTSDDTVTTIATPGSGDAEGVAYGANTLFIAGGKDGEFYKINLGANGVLGGGDDSAFTSVDTEAIGFHDLEGIEYNSDSGTLFIVSTSPAETYLGEVSTTGSLLKLYDLSYLGSQPRSGLAYGPGSKNPAIKSIYLAGRGVDNNDDSDENDGKIWEISLIPDSTPPTVTSIVRSNGNPTNASNVGFTVAFSEPVTGVDAGDFSLATTGVSGAAISGISGSGASRTVTVNTGSGSGTIRLNLIDDDSIRDASNNRLGGTGAGNGNFNSGEIYTIDKTAPVVTSILRANGNPTNASSVGFTVTFSKAVTGVDTGDFSLTTTGVSGAAISGISGSGASRTVTVNIGSGSGTIRLNLVDNDSIKDIVNNALGGNGAGNGNFNSGETYSIQQYNADTTGVFRPSNGVIFLKNTNATGFADIALNYGLPGDYPVTGDWDGDGDATIGIYRNGIFYLRNSNTIGFADLVFAFGQPGDQPIAGDWDSDNIDTIGVYRPSVGLFLLRNSNSAGPANVSFYLGTTGDVGIAGDWDGDGMDSTGVFRPSNGVIFLKNANNTGFADIALNYGLPGDQPVTGDWDADGMDTIGVYRNGIFYLRNANTIGFADIVFALGIPGDMPIAGDWDGLP